MKKMNSFTPDETYKKRYFQEISSIDNYVTENFNQAILDNNQLRYWTFIIHPHNVDAFLDSRPDSAYVERLNDEFTALHWAAYNGNLDIVTSLVEHGANMNAKFHSYTPADVAEFKKHVDVLNYLKGQEKRINDKDKDMTRRLDALREQFKNREKSILLEAVMAGDLKKVIAILPDHPKQFESIDAYTPLTSASEGGNLEIVKALLKSGKFDINAGGYAGYTPLLLAARKKHIGIVQYLLNNKADILKNKNKFDDTILHIAASSKWSANDLIILNGFNLMNILNAPNSDGDTALHLAAQYQSEDVLQWLIEKGADPYLINRNSKMPLEIAASKQSFKNIIELLAKTGIISGREHLVLSAAAVSDFCIGMQVLLDRLLRENRRDRIQFDNLELIARNASPDPQKPSKSTINLLTIILDRKKGDLKTRCPTWIPRTSKRERKQRVKLAKR